MPTDYALSAMRVLCFGSLNLDHIYNVRDFVRPGETCQAQSVEQHCGGKGFNQAIAAAKAGLPVSLAGCIGADGQIFRKKCREIGIDTTCLTEVDVPTGSAVIQVNQQGENCILLYGGANQAVTQAYIDEVLNQFQAGDVLMIQNEMSQLTYLVETAARKGLRIALNPSPMNDEITPEILKQVTWLFVNEVEAEQLCGACEIEAQLQRLQGLCDNGTVVLTLGSAGSCCRVQDKTVVQSAFSVDVVDTTAAGDTFTGYFLAAILESDHPERALLEASKASALAVTRKGAFDSIPWREEVTTARLVPGAPLRFHT